MIGNYAKIAYRNFIRNKLYSAISIIGLAIGISCCLLIFLYVENEISFEEFHANKDNLYRMIQFEGERSELSGGTESNSPLLQTELDENFPEILYSTRIMASEQIVSYGNKSFNQMIVNVDPDFFLMFSFALIQGNKSTALNDSRSVVLSTEMTDKYFGSDDPIGKMVDIQLGEAAYEFMVSGVIEEAPNNSSIQYDFIIPTSAMKYSVPEEHLDTWDLIFVTTYLQLSDKTDLGTFEERVTNHISAVAIEEDGDEYNITYKLQPISDIHLNMEYGGEMIPNSNPLYSYILALIALTVLIIACINFTTLSIGRSHRRSREIGLRKVNGALKFQIMKQFWGEALFLSIISSLAGILLVELFLPIFNDLAQKQLALNLFSNWRIIGAVGAIIVVTSLLAGFYPAVYLSKMIPIESIRGAHKPGGKNRLTQGLVILQFSLAILLIIGTIVISHQINYVKDAELGFDKNLVITFPTGSEGQDAANMLERLRTELSDKSFVSGVTGFSYEFSQSWLYMKPQEEGGTIVLIGEDITSPGYSQEGDLSSIYFYVNFVDPNFIPTMGIQLVDGRNFSEEHLSDSTEAIIINQTAVESMGLTNPIGSKLPLGFSRATIIGVIEDFHFYPLQRKVEPLVLHMPRHTSMTSIFEIAIRINSDNIPKSLATIEQTWDRISGGKPFEYSFLDDKIGEQYANETRWRGIVQYSSVISIMVTCLGLFGLTSLAVAKRNKEIGIRKVLGASVPNILRVLVREFLLLVIIANLIAWPVAYFLMNKWLENFAYRTDIGITIFLLAGFSAIFVALLTVSYQSIKAARANPIKAIQHE